VAVAKLLILSKKARLPYKAETQSNKLPDLLGVVMIDVIIADDQELSCIGMAEVLAVVDDVRIVSPARSPEQLLNTLKNVNPQVLILSTNFLPAFSKIQLLLVKGHYLFEPRFSSSPNREAARPQPCCDADKNLLAVLK